MLRKNLSFIITVFLLAYSDNSLAEDYTSYPIHGKTSISSDRKAHEKQENTGKLTLSAWPSATWGKTNDGLMQQKGHFNSQTIGADYWLFPNVDIGAFYLHNHIKLHSPVNSTKRLTNVNGIYPFINFYILPWLYLQGEGGYSKSTTDGSDHRGGPFANLYRTYKIHSHQWLGMGTLNAVTSNSYASSGPGAFLQLGYIFTNSITKEYTASDGTVSPKDISTSRNVFVLAELNYTIPVNKFILTSITPSIFGGLDHDLESNKLTALNGYTQLQRNKAGHKAGANLNFKIFKKDNIGLHYTHIGGHSHLKTNEFTVDLRISL